jgi:hypothetical protein
LYPKGLSRQGVRYASTIIGVDQNAPSPGQSQPLVAFLDTLDSETDSVLHKAPEAVQLNRDRWTHG